MQSDSIAKLQRKTSIHRRTSVKTDEKEFKGRSQDSEWKDSSKINNCSLCSKAFTLTFRKHHCRECGGVFCGPCSAYKVVINATLKRVRILYIVYQIHAPGCDTYCNVIIVMRLFTSPVCRATRSLLVEVMRSHLY